MSAVLQQWEWIRTAHERYVKRYQSMDLEEFGRRWIKRYAAGWRRLHS